MALLLVVHHTVSPATQELLEAVLGGTRAEGIEGGEVRVRAALVASALDVLEADGFLLGTPANIGYLSGALKHFFDGIYYPTLTEKACAPYALYGHGQQGTDGTDHPAESIAKGLCWERVSEPVVVMG